MSQTWNTKYGPRRVRFDPPTIQEAIVAAQGLTSEPHEQVEIAAALMDVPVEEVRAEFIKMPSARRSAQIVMANREGAARAVIVERRTSRRPAAAGRGGGRFL